MLRKMYVSAAILCAAAGLSRASDQDDLGAALSKLADSPNYSWKTTVEGGFGASETTGKTQKDGLTSLSVTRQDTSYDVFIQGDKAVAKTDDGWKSTAELTAAGGGGGGGGPSPERFLGMMIQNFKTPVALAQQYAGKLENVKKTDDGFTADMTEEQAKAALAMRRRGGQNGGAPAFSNVKATIKVSVKDGIITKFENHITGTVTFNGNDRDIDRTTTTEIKDVGSTVITLPDDAKAKLSAAPATQP